LRKRLRVERQTINQGQSLTTMDVDLDSSYTFDNEAILCAWGLERRRSRVLIVLFVSFFVELTRLALLRTLSQEI